MDTPKQIRTECFAYKPETKTAAAYCSALDNFYCTIDGKCNFYCHKQDVNMKKMARDIKAYTEKHKEYVPSIEEIMETI